MKKFLLLICLLLVGCGSENKDNGIDNNIISDNTLKILELNVKTLVDTVRMQYTENLFTDISGEVKDLSISGERPISGTYETSGGKIILKDVKFSSYKYVCNAVDYDIICNKSVTSN